MVLVSLIIPAHNEGENLKRTIDSIKNISDFRNYEIIVVDDMSTDKSTKFLQKKNYYYFKLLNSH